MCASHHFFLQIVSLWMFQRTADNVNGVNLCTRFVVAPIINSRIAKRMLQQRHGAGVDNTKSGISLYCNLKTKKDPSNNVLLWNTPFCVCDSWISNNSIHNGQVFTSKRRVENARPIPAHLQPKEAVCYARKEGKRHRITLCFPFMWRLRVKCLLDIVYARN